MIKLLTVEEFLKTNLSEDLAPNRFSCNGEDVSDYLKDLQKDAEGYGAKVWVPVSVEEDCTQDVVIVELPKEESLTTLVHGSLGFIRFLLEGCYSDETETKTTAHYRNTSKLSNGEVLESNIILQLWWD